MILTQSDSQVDAIITFGFTTPGMNTAMVYSINKHQITQGSQCAGFGQPVVVTLCDHSFTRTCASLFLTNPFSVSIVVITRLTLT